MINKILKGLVDFIYGTSRVRRNYQMNHPDETVAAADGSKSIMTSADQDIIRSFGWVTSQRAVLLLTNKNLICGKWTIPLESIVSAQLVIINSWLGGAQVLKIKTKDNNNYQFGMQLNPEWTEQQFLPLPVEKGKMKYSVYSIIIRIILISIILYWLYKWLI